MSTPEAESAAESVTDEEERADDSARLEVLREENDRLRREVRRASQVRYRRSALALGAVGVIGIAAAWYFPSVRDVLLALGAIGVFGGVLTYYLTPERVLTASVAANLAETLAALDGELAAELGLRDDLRVYVPGRGGSGPVRLFVPQHANYRLPARLDSVFVVAEDERARGVALHPAGTALFEELAETLASPLSDEPADAAAQLAEAVVEQFELAAAIDVDAGDEAVSFGVRGAALGSPRQFDHPVPSLLAVGLATALEEPIALDVATDDDGRLDAVVTCSIDRTDRLTPR